MICPGPHCVSEPLPLIAFGTERASERLKASAALSTTAPLPSVPAAPPPPIWSVPALTVVVPL